jgi:hypothetical protein
MLASVGLDLEALLGGDLDPETIERLRTIDRDELRAMLSRYLTDEEVEAIFDRIDQLLRSQQR